MFVKSSYSKYKKVEIKSGLDGFEVARRILDSNGLNNVDIAFPSSPYPSHAQFYKTYDGVEIIINEHNAIAKIVLTFVCFLISFACVLM